MIVRFKYLEYRIYFLEALHFIALSPIIKERGLFSDLQFDKPLLTTPYCVYIEFINIFQKCDMV